MKTLFLIRHCAPEFPGGQKMCIGNTDLPLSREGHAQAAALARSLPEVTAVFSSPLTRSVETAGYLSGEVHLLEGLREIGVGQWEGLTFAQIREAFPDHYAARGDDPTLPPPGGEGPEAALPRFREALRQAAEAAPGDCALVTHGGILAAFWQECTGVWRKPGYGEVLALSWDGEKTAASGR